MVRFYIQLPDDTDFVNGETRRVDMAKASPERIMESAAKILQPFRVAKRGEAEWWTVYISCVQRDLECRGVGICYMLMLGFWLSSWAARCEDVFCSGPGLHCGRRVPYALSQSRCVRVRWHCIGRFMMLTRYTTRPGHECKHVRHAQPRYCFMCHGFCDRP